MGVTHVHSFLVPPSKDGPENGTLLGTSVPLKGDLFRMIEKLFSDAAIDCPIEIVFRPSAEGFQLNQRRDLFLTYLGAPTLPNAREIATVLHSVTTRRSGLGLLFTIVGSDGQRERLVLARFPADQGVVAEERKDTLQVQFLERVFMKSAFTYKSATYSCSTVAAGFWDGRAVDKQADGPRELSHYWISDFLLSDFRTTGAAGTIRLARALRKAIGSTSEVGVRGDLIAFAQLLGGMGGRTIAPTTLVETMGVSRLAAQALLEAFDRSGLSDESFVMDHDEFLRQLPHRVVELDNGAVLMGSSESFDRVFARQPLPDNRQRFTTEGMVVDQRLTKRN
jgi:hypothetical protein